MKRTRLTKQGIKLKISPELIEIDLLIKYATTGFSLHPNKDQLRGFSKGSDLTSNRFTFELAAHLLIGLLICLMVVWTPVLANPEGGQVIAGSATINNTAPGRLDIVQSSDKAIIDWRGFSIQSGEHTHFQQPSASSVALNRVTGRQSSAIYGSLTANGRVVLVNPNGVLFGKNSQVNVGSLIATTSNIGNDDFMAGKFIFDRGSNDLNATVINRGQIEVTEGGAVVLAATSVANEGLIKARLGQVVLAGINSYTVDFNGDGLVQFDLGEQSNPQDDTSTNQSSNTPVSNSGTIVADGGVVQMTARVANSIVDKVINMEGVIQARAVDVKGGSIILSGGETGIVSVSGTLDASGSEPGQIGGVVKVLGEKVGLFNGTAIDVSGDAGGGDSLIGGNFQGKGPETNAKRTYIAEKAVIDASAISKGDGGKVIVWSDQVTGYRGSITAKGGKDEGDGGFVEVSGKQSLEFKGIVDVSSEKGSDGSVLLDPESISIVAEGGANNSEISDGEWLFGDGPTSGVSTVDAPTVEALLGDIIFQATENIVVDAALNLVNQTEGERVVFQAGNDININADIQSSGADLFIEADSPFADFDGSNGIGTVSVSDDVTVNGFENIHLIGADFEISNSARFSSTGQSFITPPANTPLVVGSGILNTSELDTIVGGWRVIIGSSWTAGENGLGFAGSGTHALGPVNASSILVDEPVRLTNIGVGIFTSDFINIGAQIEVEVLSIVFRENFSLAEGVILNSTNLRISNNGGTIGVGLTDPTADVNLTSDILDQFETQSLTLDGSTGLRVNGLVSSDFAETVTSLVLISGGALGSIDFISTSTELQGINLDIRTGGVATVNAPINADNITLVADDLNLNALISSDGQLIIQHAAFFADEIPLIGIGGQVEGGLNIDTAELDFLSDGFSNILINSFNKNASDGTILIGNADFRDPVEFRMGSTGSIVLNGGLTVDGSVSFTGESVDGEATEIRLAGSIGTSSGSITINQNAVLDGSLDLFTTLESSPGDLVDIQGTLDGAHTLNINAGIGNISLNGVVGGAIPLSNLFSSGSSISLIGGVTTNGIQSYTGSVTQTAPIKARSLMLQGSGSITLDNPLNDIEALLVSMAGEGQDLVYQDANQFSISDGFIGEFGTFNGITTNNGNVTLNAPDKISINSDIITKGGDINLNTGLNNPGSISLSERQTISGEPPTITTQINTNGGNFTAIGVGNIVSELSDGISISNTHINAAGGNISLTGNGLGGGGGNGINIDQGSIVETSGIGSLRFEGVGGSGVTTGAIGILARDTGTTLQSENGNIEIIGNAGGATGSQNNDGVSIFNGAVVESMGIGDILITGTGGEGIDNQGIAIGTGLENDSSSIIRSVDGNINLDGTGIGTVGGPINFGNHGVFIFDNASIVTSGSGSITVQGKSGANGAGIFASNVFQSQNPIRLSTASETAKLTLRADTVNLNTPTEVSGPGILELEPLDPNLDITVGLSNSIQDGFLEIFIGHENGTGTVAVDSAGITFTDNTTIRSPGTGGNIVVNGAIQTIGDDGINLALIAGSNVDVNANITTNGGNLDVTSGGDVDSGGIIDTGADDGDAGTVNIEAIGNISVADIVAKSPTGSSSEINLTSTGGNIDTTAGKLATFAELVSEAGGDASPIRLEAFGDINTGDISASALEGNGGDITLISQNGVINSGELNTISVPRNSGAISLEAQGTITTGDLFASALNQTDDSGSGNTGNAGNITLISEDGDINTEGLLAPASASAGSAGDGGAISVTAENGEISVNGLVWSFSEAENDTGSGGSINFTAKNDIEIASESSTLFGIVQSASRSQSGTAGNGGLVNLQSSEGSIIIEDAIATFTSGSNSSGNGGAVEISAASDLIINGINTNSGGAGTGGNISVITTNGSLTVNQDILAGTGEISLTANETTAETIADLTIAADLTASSVVLRTADSLIQTAGNIQTAALGIDANDASLRSNSVDTLAVNLTGLGENFSYSNLTDLLVGSIGSVTGITLNNGDLSLGSTGDLVIAQALSGQDGNIILQAEEDITVNASLNLTNQAVGERVVFQAGKDITINESIETQGAEIHFEADSPHSTIGAADGIGSLNILAPVSSNGGDITLIHSEALSISAPVNAESGDLRHTVSINNADLTIQNLGFFNQILTTGTVFEGQASTAGNDGLGNGAIILTFGSNTLAVPLILSNQFAGELQFITNNDFTLNQSLTTNQPISINADVDGDSNGAVNVNSAIVTNGETLSISSGEQISIDNDITTSGGDINLNVGLNNPGSIRLIADISSDPSIQINTNGGNFTAIGAGNIVSRSPNRGPSDGIAMFNTHINAAGGTINLTGNGISGGNGNGILIGSGSIFETSGVGILNLEGTGSSDGTVSAAANDKGKGVFVRDTGTTLRSENGNIEIIGIGGVASGGRNNDGVSIFNGAIVEASGTGDILITGTGGEGIDNQGIAIGTGPENDSNSIIRSVDGNINLDGTGIGTVGGPINFGNHGVFIFDNASIVTSGSGSITVQGKGGANGTGIFASNVFQSQNPIRISTASETAKLTLRADTVNLNTPTEVSGPGILELEPLDPSLDITVGLSNSIQDGFSEIFIGHENGTGTVTVDSAGITFTDNTTLRSPGTGGEIVVNVAIQTIGDDGINLALNAGSNVDVNANITTNGGNLDVTSGGVVDSSGIIDTGADDGDAGTVNIEATGNISVADIVAKSPTGSSSEINLTSTGGNIDTTAGELATFAELVSEAGGDASPIRLEAFGDINTGDISASALEGNGGDITLISQNGVINSGELNTISVPRNSGAISLEAQGNITTGDLFASALNQPDESESGNTGNAGNITLISEDGDINTGGLLAPASASVGSAGDGGAISVTAENGEISVNGVVWSFSEAENDTGSGGSISFTAKNDIEIASENSTLFGIVQSASRSESGTTGNGGLINLQSSEGNIIIEDAIATFTSGSNSSGNGGGVDISAASDLIINGINTSSGGAGTGGNISVITTNGSLTVNQDILAGTGEISLTANETTAETIADLTTAADLTASSVVLRAADSLIQTAGNIQTTALGIEAHDASLTSNSFDTLAVKLTGLGENFSYSNLRDLLVGSVGSVTGITLNNGGLDLAASGNLNIEQAISGIKNASLSANETDPATVSNLTLAADVIANSSVFLSAADSLIQTAGNIQTTDLGIDANNASLTSNSFDTLAVNLRGLGENFSYSNFRDLLVGSVGSVTGITLNNGDLDLAASGNLIIEQAISGIKNASLSANETDPVTVSNLTLAADVSANNSVVLRAADSLIQTAGNIQTTNLGIDANDGSLRSNSFDTLAVNLTGLGENFSYSNLRDLLVGSVGSISGITLNNGDLDLAASGNLNIEEAISGIKNASLSANETDPATVSNLTLAADVTANNSVVLSAADSLIQTAGNIQTTDLGIDANVASLASNSFDTLAVNLTGLGENFSYSNLRDLLVGSVGSVTGITLNNGDLDLSASGNLTIEQAISGVNNASLSANETNPATVSNLTIAADVTANNSVVLSAADSLIQTAGNIQTTDLGIDAHDASLTSNLFDTLAVKLTGLGENFSYSNLRDLLVGSVGSISGITLNNGDLDLAASGNLIIEQAISGIKNASLSANETDPVTVSNLTLAADVSANNSVVLRAADSLIQTAGNIQTTNLGIDANDASLRSNSFDTLAVNLTGLGENFSYSNLRDLLVGSVGSISGITLNNGDLDLVASGNLIIEQAISGIKNASLSANETDPSTVSSLTIAANVIANSSVFLSAADSITQTVGTIRTVALGVDGNDASLLESNSIDTLAVNLSGLSENFSYSDLNALKIGSVGVVSGITLNNGDLDLAASGNLVIEKAFSGVDDVNLSAAMISAKNIASSGSQNFTGDTLLAGNFSTNGRNFNVLGNSTLTDDTIINTSGGNVQFDGRVLGNKSLTILADVGGDVVFTNDIGSLDSISATGNSISLHDVTTTGAQTYTGSVTFNSEYTTNGGGFTVNGSSLLLSDTFIATNGGQIAFNGEINGSNSLTLSAGNSGNILFDKDVGVLSALPLIDIQSANNLSVLGRLQAEQMNVTYQGNFTTGSSGFLEVGGLSLSPDAQSASISGVVGGATGKNAALRVEGPVGNKVFTINECTIGISCEIPPEVDPILPREIFPDDTSPAESSKATSSESPGLEPPTVVSISVAQRSPPSDDPTQYQFSNLGNEELWDNNPGGYSVSSFAAFTVSSPKEQETKKVEDNSED